MVRLAQAVPGKLPRNQKDRAIVLTSAVIIVTLVVSQLFAFETFPHTLEALRLPGGERVGLMYAAAIVVAEVFAVPALLAMRLSKLMRYTSLVMGWTTWLFWLFAGVWALATVPNSNNLGLLGSKIPLPVSWVTVIGIVVLMFIYGLAWRAMHKNALT